LVEDVIIRVRSAAEKIGDDSSGANFRNYPHSQGVARAIDRHEFNFRKFFAEFVEQRFAAVAADVEVKLTFFLGRGNRLFPSRLPRRLCIRSEQRAGA
jgi:hypothetical protein